MYWHLCFRRRWKPLSSRIKVRPVAKPCLCSGVVNLSSWWSEHTRNQRRRDWNLELRVTQQAAIKTFSRLGYVTLRKMSRDMLSSNKRLLLSQRWWSERMKQEQSLLKRVDNPEEISAHYDDEVLNLLCFDNDKISIATRYQWSPLVMCLAFSLSLSCVYKRFPPTQTLRGFNLSSQRS